MKNIWLFMALFFISACHTPEKLSQIRHEKCAKDYGLKKGTIAYAQCRKGLDDDAYGDNNVLHGFAAGAEKANRNSPTRSSTHCTPDLMGGFRCQ